jgi:hypothetical protein
MSLAGSVNNFIVLGFYIQGWRVAKLGGNANNGTNAGVAYWNLNNSSGNTNQNIASQVSLLNV